MLGKWVAGAVLKVPRLAWLITLASSEFQSVTVLVTKTVLVCVAIATYTDEFLGEVFCLVSLCLGFAWDGSFNAIFACL